MLSLVYGRFYAGGLAADVSSSSHPGAPLAVVNQVLSEPERLKSLSSPQVPV